MKLLQFKTILSYAFQSICLLVAVTFVVSSTQLTHAAQEKRVALVIGNSAYENTTQLNNPKNDAEDMEITLEAIGFDVTKVDNANYSTMRKALRDFGRKAQGAEIALVYFAGHGMEVDKNNYLIPVDAQLLSDQDVEYEAISIELLNRAVAGAKGLRMILLDACRNNPFVNKMSRSISTRAIGRGLAPVEPQHGTLVSYAAREGTTASDGDGRNSPYTKALISHLKEPGLDIRFMFAKVRDSVLAATGGEQEPFMYGSLPGKQLHLVPKEEDQTTKNDEKEESTTSPLVTFDPTKTNNGAFELEYWNSIKNSEDVDYLQSYLDQYPDGKFAPLAQIKIRRLELAKKEAAERTEIAVVITPMPEEKVIPERQLDENLRSRILDFVRYGYLSASTNNPAHLRNIYSTQVSYYGEGLVFVDEVIKDKQSYFKRWPNYYYELVAGSDNIEQLDRDNFEVSFNSRFELESSSKKTHGTSNTKLTLMLFGGQFRITSENSKVINQSTEKTIIVEKPVVQNCTAKDGPYQVINIRSNDTLNVRSDVNTSSKILGELGHNATGIHVTACFNGWCEIKYGCLRGYASQKYLSNGSGAVSTSNQGSKNLYHVVGHTSSEELNVRNGPSTKYQITGTIPHNGSQIIVNACNFINGYKYKWCQISYERLNGWAYGKYLADSSGALAK